MSEKMNEYKKVPVGLSFSGEKGHIALEVLNTARSYKKSELVVELLLVYKKAQQVLGKENTMAKLWTSLDNMKEKSN